jgi:hypothetical protein
MDSAEYTLKDVMAIYPQINPRTIQVWIKRGVLRPLIESAGQGFPVKFSYLNLVEIGLIWQIIKIGQSSHKLLSMIMDHARKYPVSWIGGQHYNYNCYFGLIETKAFGKQLSRDESDGSVEWPPNYLINPKKLQEFIEGMPLVAGWLVIDVRLIKSYVNNKLIKSNLTFK